MSEPSFDLHVGDVRAILPTLRDGSVDCVITSPPYWGLRDYGTGAWSGGDADCDHKQRANHGHAGDIGTRNADGNAFRNSSRYVNQGDEASNVCGKCGATRTDNQIGLEATPDEYVATMVAIFREIRRVLADHGTCWVNLGDSYASSPPGNKGTPDEAYASSGLSGAKAGSRYMQTLASSVGTKRNTVVGDLKPKDLVGIPWRVAFALQADGWYLRSAITWCKPNCMPESVTDRPTKATEMVFLLTKRPRYFYDADAVRENVTGNAHARGNGVNPKALVNEPGQGVKQNASFSGAINELVSSRNLRDWWEIPTQAYSAAHFATYPEELVRRCLLAGCPEWVCRTCGKPRERIVEREVDPNYVPLSERAPHGMTQPGNATVKHGSFGNGRPRSESGFTDCGHGDFRRGVVLDPFLGSGTTALVARRHGRSCVGIELSADYAALARERVRWWHRRPEAAPEPIVGQMTFAELGL